VLPLAITVHTSTLTLATGMAIAALASLGLTLPAESTVWQVEKAGRSKVRASRWWPVVTAALYAAVPVGAMYAASLRRPMYNPKFLLLATPAYGLLLARGLEALTSVARRLGRTAERLTLGIVLLAVLAPMGWSLYGLYANPAFFRDDYRGIVAYISAAAGPGDAILVDAPAQVETVDYYYQGAWPVYALPRMRPADRAATETELADILARHRRLYAIYWATDESDPEGIIENYLAAHAFKASDAWHGNVRLVVYDSVRQAPAEPEVSTAYRLGEAVVLEGYALLTPEIAAGDVAQVSLFWRADAPLKQSLKVFVHLVDANGAIIGQHDAEPAGSSRPTTSWAAGELVRDNHGILVQPGTPAGTVTLRVGLYDGATGKRLPVSLGGQPLGDAVDLVTLPLIAPAEPLPIEAFDVERRTEVSLMGMDVLGYSLYPLGLRHEARRSLRPGEAAELLLYARGPNMPLEARLERHGAAIVTVAYDALTAGVPSGHIARGTRQFTIPANAPVGRYRLVVTVGGQSASLGTVEIER